MKITFLGTSHGVPASDRFWSSTMIEINGALYFIDCGAPVIDLVLREGHHPNEIKGVFATHGHGDHISGLVPLVDICAWYFKETSFDIFVAEQETAELTKKFISFAENGIEVSSERLRFHVAHEGEVFTDENIKVTYFRTQHVPTRPTYSILVEAEGKKLLFSGDMSWMMQKNDFPKYALENELDFFVCELAHFGLEQLSDYLPNVKTKQLYFNHVWPLDKLEKIEELHASNNLPYPVYIANDGDKVEV